MYAKFTPFYEPNVNVELLQTNLLHTCDLSLVGHWNINRRDLLDTAGWPSYEVTIFSYSFFLISSNRLIPRSRQRLQTYLKKSAAIWLSIWHTQVKSRKRPFCCFCRVDLLCSDLKLLQMWLPASTGLCLAACRYLKQKRVANGTTDVERMVVYVWAYLWLSLMFRRKFDPIITYSLV